MNSIYNYGTLQNVPTVKLNNGYEMPMLGIGTILRWDYQNNVVVIPGSSNPNHILENISIFDFELSDEEMKQIENLNRDEKHDWY